MSPHYCRIQMLLTLRSPAWQTSFSLTLKDAGVCSAGPTATALQKLVNAGLSALFAQWMNSQWVAGWPLHLAAYTVEDTIVSH